MARGSGGRAAALLPCAALRAGSALCFLLSQPAAAQSDTTARTVRLRDGVVEFEARPDGRVAIGAVGTVRIGVAAGTFAPLALLTWLDQLDVLASPPAATAVADSVPLQSADGALIVVASRALSESGERGLALTFVRSTSPAAGAALLRLFITAAPDRPDSAGPAPATLATLRAAAAGAAARARALAPEPLPLGGAATARRAGADSGSGGGGGGRPKRMPAADRLFVTVTIGVAGEVAGAGLDGAILGCELYRCWRPGIEGFAVGGVLGYALGATLTRDRASCGARRAFALGAGGAALGAVPGLVVAGTRRPNAALPLMLLGQAVGTVVAGRWCG